MDLLDRLGLTLPIIQAPMAGVSTPALAAAVSNAGGLGSIAVGATDAAGAQAMVSDLHARTNAAFNVNVFVHDDPKPDPATATAWCAALRPLFSQFGATPPGTLRVIYRSFAGDQEMFETLLTLAPPVVSFHFGLPEKARIDALKARGCVLLATATTLRDGQAAERAGIDAIVAQGFEAGGHRGTVDLNADDERLGTLALTRLLATHLSTPVIAAGGIMDGAGIRAALDLGAIAAQLGTAFIGCPESAADDGYRRALAGAEGTVMTSAISGRPARCLTNAFTRWGARADAKIPDYPIAYDAGKALNAAAKAAGDTGYGAHWAGQGAPLSRALLASDLMALLRAEAGL